jgi:hypothetical protein
MLGELLLAEKRPAGLKPFEPDQENGVGKRNNKSSNTAAQSGFFYWRGQ